MAFTEERSVVLRAKQFLQFSDLRADLMLFIFIEHRNREKHSGFFVSPHFGIS